MSTIQDIIDELDPERWYCERHEEFVTLTNVNRNVYKDACWKGIVDDIYSELLFPSTIIILPFRRLGMPLKLLESMAAAKPIITTRIEWTTEYISNGITGYTVDVGDVNAIVNQINSILTFPEHAVTIGQKARNLIQIKCDLDISSQHLITIFKEASYENTE